MTNKKDINNLKEAPTEADKEAIEAAKAIFDPLKKEEERVSPLTPEENKKIIEESFNQLLKTDSQFNSKYNEFMDKVIKSMIRSALEEELEKKSESTEEPGREFLSAAHELSKLIRRSKI